MSGLPEDCSPLDPNPVGSVGPGPPAPILPFALLVVLMLAVGRLGPCESRAQQVEVMDTPEIERMQALNQGGDPAPGADRLAASPRAVGLPYAGRLKRGVRLPSEDAGYFTWDPVRNTTPNRWWRRYGTDRLVRTLLDVLGEFQDAHPDAPRVGIGDLSRLGGGNFGPRFGSPAMPLIRTASTSTSTTRAWTSASALR